MLLVRGIEPLDEAAHLLLQGADLLHAVARRLEVAGKLQHVGLDGLQPVHVGTLGDALERAAEALLDGLEAAVEAGERRLGARERDLQPLGQIRKMRLEPGPVVCSGLLPSGGLCGDGTLAGVRLVQLALVRLVEPRERLGGLAIPRLGGAGPGGSGSGDRGIAPGLAPAPAARRLDAIGMEHSGPCGHACDGRCGKPALPRGNPKRARFRFGRAG